MLPTDPAARKALPLWRGVHEFFPAALAGVARVTVSGSRQHHGGDDLYDDRSKSNDDADCLLRHLHDAMTGDGMDGDVPHVDKVAWRALRIAQKWHEQHGAPLAPGARVREESELAQQISAGVSFLFDAFNANDREPGFVRGTVHQTFVLNPISQADEE